MFASQEGELDSKWIARLSVRMLTPPEEALQTAQQYHYHSTVGIATIYRNIRALIKEGWLQPVEVPEDSTPRQSGAALARSGLQSAK
jgi:hypothetical protein